ncbi:MAG: hypothetical protein QM718_09895 [Steroidobacteraceae bacterium]
MTQPAGSPREVSPYDRLQWPIAALENFLASGAHRRELIGYFGERDYHRLAALARKLRHLHALRGRNAGAPLPRVYVVPGILGSQLGQDRAAPQPADLLWIDPIDVIGGHLQAMRVPDGDALRPLGVIAYTYLALKLQLGVAGFDVRLHDYDWRQSVAELGVQLAAELERDPAPSVDIVAHSLGGLVARVAMAQARRRIRRLVTLGTPQLGSFGAVQALRGSYPVVLRLAALDQRHDAATLAREVFGSFPSLYDMLPVPQLTPELDLLDAAHWPAAGVQPRAELLQRSRTLTAQLAPLDEHCFAIVGTGQPTVTRCWIQDDEFRYLVERHGDGTVPLASAAPGHERTWFVNSEHSELARNERVMRACIDLLQHGDTGRLGRRRPARPRAQLQIGDAELSRAYPTRVDWTQLSPQERVGYFNQLNLPPAQYLQLRGPQRSTSRASGRWL